MANTLMTNVPENFDMEVFGQRLQECYQAKGFQVSRATISNSVRIQFDKGCGGINILLGMGKGITANCTLQGNALVVNYSDGDWTGKIVGLIVGWVLCFIPLITALIGCIGQNSLPKEINNDIMMIIGSFNNVKTEE